jgi:folate-binding protein YgfZ
MVAISEMVLRPDSVVLWTQRHSAQQLFEGLDKFVIMDDVELAIDEEVALIELLGPAAPQIALAAGIAWPEAGLSAVQPLAAAEAVMWSGLTGGAPGSPLGEAMPALYLMIPRDSQGDVAGLLVEAGASIGSHAARELLRVASGQLLLAKDIADGSLPLEVGLKGAVSFRKGCYVGQEAIAMMTYRGQIRRHLCWVQGQIGQGWVQGQVAQGQPECGWSLKTAEGKRAGRLGTCISLGQSWYGLAMVPRKAYAAGAALQVVGEDGSSAPAQLLGTTVVGILDSVEGAG